MTTNKNKIVEQQQQKPIGSLIEVIYESYTTITQYADPEDRWSADSTHSDVTIKGIKLVAEQSYEDLTIPFVAELDTTYYLLFARYSTGDSFSSHSGRVEFVDLFTTHEKAVTALNQINQSHTKNARNKKWDERYGFWYNREDGTQITEKWAVWDGYFECLESLEIQEVTL